MKIFALRMMVVFIVVASLALAASSPSIENYSSKTVAICEHSSQNVTCKDVLLVTCNDFQYVFDNKGPCDKYMVFSVTGNAVYGANWMDPR